MSGGHFDYKQYQLGEIAETIKQDIALALQPKPEMIHEDFWSIYEMDTPYSSHPFAQNIRFHSSDEAEAFLRKFKKVKEVDSKFKIPDLINKGIVLQSTEYYMREAEGQSSMPVLYSIYHCEYDHYPYDTDVLELDECTLRIMKDAYKKIRIAEIYANNLDSVLSGNSGEEDLAREIKADIDKFEEEFKSIDWSHYDDEN